ncbi:hypothetical protein V500_06998 [Pseudogymnoascus sp. VKM F-4518 (FW-2643)]|nr:hypothetical protein V500_06998 [Pseudogymnoascus sp. VKM F-4518 (FW-2643)]
MPKTSRASVSQGQYRSIPVAITDNTPQQHYYPITTTATMQSNLGPQRMTHMHQQAPSYISNPPMQASAPQYIPQSAPIPISTRPSSGAWSPTDDLTLMGARTQGQNWGQIQDTYFPNKTANACRKRHERLMDRRNSEDWDTLKFETLGKEYMAMRREIWTPLAERTGDKWAVVEAKILGSGLKNLQSAARASTRRARLSASHDSQNAPASYTDDSAIGIEDLDGGDFSVSPDTDCGFDPTRQSHQLQIMGAHMASHQQHQQMMREQQQQQQQHHQNRQYIGGQVMQGRGHSHHNSLGSATSERNMGIPSIINRGPAGV